MNTLLLVMVGTALLGTVRSQLTTLLGSSNSSGHQQQMNGYCTRQERSAAFGSCILSFGMSHLQHFNVLAWSAPICRAEVFRCAEMDRLMKCLNTQPTTKISNRCWVLMPQVLTASLKSHNIPCSYNHLAAKCQGQFTQLLPVERRPTTGRGSINNPIQGMFNAMMIYNTLSGGGLGGLGGLGSMLSSITKGFGA